MLSGTLVLVRCTSSMRWTHSVTRRMSLLWQLAGTRLKWSARTSVTENREHLSPFYKYVIWWSSFFVQLSVACLIPSPYTFRNCYQCRFSWGRYVKGYGMCAYVHACRLVLCTSSFWTTDLRGEIWYECYVIAGYLYHIFSITEFLYVRFNS